MKPNKLLVLTGGGTAGHVMPHVALLPYFRTEGWDLLYIGSHAMERNLMGMHGVAFVSIASGKLRRYFSWKNMGDVFRILLGVLQAIWILLRKRPRAIFSKGGYVSVPVCFAGWLLRIPVVTHESDFSPGLATKLIQRVAHRVCYSFPESQRFFPREKGLYSGNPVRKELGEGSREEGNRLCGFSDTTRPVLLVMGGSLGALALNEFIYANMDALLARFRVVHITGQQKNRDLAREGYRAFSYVNQELPHLYATTQLALSRAGANSLFELQALGIPMILIPLENGSRGDQVENADLMVRAGAAQMVRQATLTWDTFIGGVERLPLRNMQQRPHVDGAQQVIMKELRKFF